MAKTAFISYATEDQEAAQAIADYLERHGVDCWIAPRDVRPGADYGSEIIDGIAASAVFVLVLSEHANDSIFVKREVERAVSKGKPIFPLRVREVAPSKSLELFISSTEWIDAWQPPLEQYLDRLADSIRAAAALYGGAAGSGAGSPTPPRPTPARPTPTRTPPAPQQRRAPLLWAAFGGLAAVVVGVGLLLMRPGEAPTPPTTPPTSPPGHVSPSSPGAPGADGMQGGNRRARQRSAARAEGDPCPKTLTVARGQPTPLTCTCPAQPVPEGAVWGTDVYTDDSALCPAALHAGVVGVAGGSVTVARGPGRPLFIGSLRGGVRSNDFGAYGGSITFAGAAPPPPGPEACPAALFVNREMPLPLTCRCSMEAAHTGSVWGTDVYTDDSSLCAAALHAGRIGPEGGEVTVVRAPARTLYVGTSRNGVQSNDFGPYVSALRFR